MNVQTASDRLIPLCVDLDGTLIAGDLLYESFLIAAKENPLIVFYCFGWLLKGKAFLKAELAARVSINYETLPYNQILLTYLHQEKNAGRSLVLATASNTKFAQGVACHLNLFDQVFSSSREINLEGQTKRMVLKETFGTTGYAYIGNSKSDLPVWSGAASRLIANASPSVTQSLQKMGSVERIFESNRSAFTLLRAIRIHQWLKNLLLFGPLIAAHRLLSLEALMQALVAFIGFSMTASAVYLINDLADLENDRKHPTKHRRPIAAGLVQIPTACGLAVFLLAGAACISTALPGGFQLILWGYFGLTLTYSFWLKRILLVDVVVLATLYTIRLVAGGVATGTVLSLWMLTFSCFIFLSLALVKRYTELKEARDRNRKQPSGRGYLLADLDQISILGVSSAMVSVLVIALYISSPQVQPFYRSPLVLLLLCPVLLYWLSRVWILASRGKIHDDPVVFAIKDRTSYGVALIAAIIIFIATFFRFQ